MQNALAVAPPMSAMPKGKSKSKKTGDDDNRGELNAISIEMTENGCIVRCSFDPETINPKFDRYAQMPEDEKYSFDDVDKAAEYVHGMMLKHADEELGEAVGDGQSKKKRFGDGGVVTEETNATLGEKGPEAVVPVKSEAEGKQLVRSFQAKRSNATGSTTYQETTPGREALSDSQLKDWNEWNDTLKKARAKFATVDPDDADEMDRHYGLIQDIKANRDAAAKPSK